jgi:hypothetical protein
LYPMLPVSLDCPFLIATSAGITGGMCFRQVPIVVTLLHCHGDY